MNIETTITMNMKDKKIIIITNYFDRLKMKETDRREKNVGTT